MNGTAIEGRLREEDFIWEAGRAPLRDVRLLAPCTPSKIIGVGRNYANHAAEMHAPPPERPLLFFKPPSAVNNPDGEIVYPRQSKRVDYEGELAVVIATRCRNVKAKHAEKVIWGYTICNDVTARDLQRTDDQWARAKGFDGFAPLGPCIASGLDPRALRLRCYLNGEIKQDAPTSALIFGVPELIEYISAAFTLERGDVISTGTPAGVGPMQPGDVVEIVIDQIGKLRNRVIAPVI